MNKDKETTNSILNFYQHKKVVKGYDQKRFSGLGGKYLNNVEIDSISRHIFSGHVLELGPGTGRLTKKLKRNNLVTLTCLDSSLEMLKLLKKKVKVDTIINQSIFDKLKVSRKFDYITALRFFDHFSVYNQNKIIRNVLPKLKGKGKFIYSCLNKNSSESLFSHLFYFSKTNYFYSFDEYKALFKKNKMKIVSYNSCFIFPRGIYLRFKLNSIFFKAVKFVDESLSVLFPKFGSLYTFVLEKD